MRHHGSYPPRSLAPRSMDVVAAHAAGQLLQHLALLLGEQLRVLHNGQVPNGWPEEGRRLCWSRWTGPPQD